jgi:squalene-hopene/tetraprenyl-beta-curcumene cyclase
MRARLLLGLPLVIALIPAAPGSAQEKKGLKGPKSWEEVTAAAAAYLKTTQADDGSWSKATHPGITGVVLTGLLKSGAAKAGDPVAAKGLKFVEGLADTKEGHLAVGEQIRHKFYTTSVNLQALKASGDKKYDPVVAAAAAYFKAGQVGAADKKTQDDPNYGGFGYGPGTRGDVSNTHFALDALVAAGTPKDDPAFKRAVVFVSRCQNLKSEFNDQPFAGKINDGSFIYVLPAAGGTAPLDTPRPGYGSMTYAGIKCLALGGVGTDDPRRKKAMDWVAHNYSVDINPGRGEGAGGQGYFYYLVSMARCLDTLGVDTVTDAAGKAHDWRAEVTRALANRQRRDGSWGNDFANWMESDPNLDTGYALVALAYARPRAK